MIPDVYWVKSFETLRLALMSRPRSGEWLEDEIVGWKAAGIDVVVSLLENGEQEELGLESEGSLCHATGIEFISYPIRDRGTPTSENDFRSLIDFIAARLSEGKGMGIHCRAGIGRTGLVAGCVLGLLGVPTNDIFPLLAHARGVSVPDTEEQKQWVFSFLKLIAVATCHSP